jgi:hypothetical protein
VDLRFAELICGPPNLGSLAKHRRTVSFVTVTILYWTKKPVNLSPHPKKRRDPPIHRVRQIAKLFLQSSELGLPQPHPQASVPPPPFGSGGGAHSLAREGVGESQFQRGGIQ